MTLVTDLRNEGPKMPPSHCERMSEPADCVAAPRDRETAVSCAYLRLTGSSQAEAAKAAGVDPRTLGRWESCSWWPAIQREAGERWLAGAAAKARRSLLAALEEPDGRLALSVLERLVPELAPARQRVELKGSLKRIELRRMPNEAIDRIANGEHPLAVLASFANRALPASVRLQAPAERIEGEE